MRCKVSRLDELDRQQLKLGNRFQGRSAAMRGGAEVVLQRCCAINLLLLDASDASREY